jgi:hypothetical protein
MMTLQTDWTLGEDRGRVAYRLKNLHPVPAYVYAIPRTAWRRRSWPRSAYALLSEGDVDLTLLLGSCPPPKGALLPAGVRPLAVAVAPGEELVGEVKLQNPIVEWGAYSLPRAIRKGRETVGVYLLRFVVEYVLEGETSFRHPAANGTWDVGGSPIRRVAAIHIPDQPVPVYKLPLSRLPKAPEPISD